MGRSRRLRNFWRSLVVDTSRCSPSWANHTGEAWGMPSGPIDASTAMSGASSRSRYSSGSMPRRYRPTPGNRAPKRARKRPQRCPVSKKGASVHAFVGDLGLALVLGEGLLGADEVGVGEHAHLGQVQAGNLVGRRAADAALEDQVRELEEGERDAAHDHDDGHGADRLRGELTPAGAPVEDAGDSRGVTGGVEVGRGAVPAQPGPQGVDAV